MIAKFPILMVSAMVRYWEDATVNGQEDKQGTLIPLRVGDQWEPSIDLQTGKVLAWPAGTTARIHYKVCDAGEYWLADTEGVKHWKWGGYYVPDDLLCVGDRGYGDYIIMKVQEDGTIENWRVPHIDLSEWDQCPQAKPEPIMEDEW